MTDRKQTYLNNKQKWEVACFCVEHRNVIQDYDPKQIEENKFYPYSIWRVGKAQTAKEINGANLENFPKISDYHVSGSINFYNEVCELTQHYPKPNPIQDTVEMDIMRVKNIKLERELEEISSQYNKIINNIKNSESKLKEYQQILNKISHMIPGECFGIKQPK